MLWQFENETRSSEEHIHDLVNNMGFVISKTSFFHGREPTITLSGFGLFRIAVRHAPSIYPFNSKQIGFRNVMQEKISVSLYLMNSFFCTFMYICNKNKEVKISVIANHVIKNRMANSDEMAHYKFYLGTCCAFNS